VALPATSAGVVGLTLTISAWVAASEGRADRRQALSDAVAHQARAVTELQSVVTERRQAAAHFLHGSVQNELVAASLRGDSMNALQSTVAEIFDSYGAGQSGPDARSALEGLLTSWSAVLDITVRIDDEAWATIALDPSKGALLVDLISEGLTNAVRHASAKTLTLEVSADGTGLNVRVITPGLPKVTGSAGLGLQTLRERGAATVNNCDQRQATLMGRGLESRHSPE
jgi:signal transduction histidine kinase